MQKTQGILVTILVVVFPLLNVVDSTLMFNDDFNFSADNVCKNYMDVHSQSCPSTESECQQALDKSLQCRYNENLERIETLYSYTKSEIAQIKANAASSRAKMEKSLADLATRTKRSTSHVKELFETFATARGKMASLRDREMSANELETRQDDLVFMNAFFDDVNATMCDVISRLDSTEINLQDLQASVSFLQGDIVGLQSSVSSLQASVSSLESGIVAVEANIDSVEADLVALDGRVTALEAKVQELCDQVAMNTANIDQLFNATAVIPEILQNLTEIEDHISDLAEQFTDSIEDTANLNETITNGQQDIDDLWNDFFEVWEKVIYLCDKLNMTEEQLAIFESTTGNLTEGLENLAANMNLLEEAIFPGQLLSIGELGFQIFFFNDTITALAQNITNILMDNGEITSNIADLMDADATTQELVDIISDNVTSLSDRYESLDVEVDLLNSTTGEVLAYLDELNDTINACCHNKPSLPHHTQPTPESMMCCNESESLDLTELENRIQALELENEVLFALFQELNYTLMEKISQLENCCSLFPANISLEFPFPFPLEPAPNGPNDGSGMPECGACDGGCECEEGEHCGCAGKICALEKKIETILKKMPDCPDGYIALYHNMDRSEFVCVKTESAQETQPDHGKNCLRDGLILAEFPCVSGFQEFRQYTQEQGGAETLFFLGASDEILENYWTWLDSGLPVNDAYWAPGEPDGGPAENCAVFNTTSGLLHDVDCASQNAGLCMIGSD